MKRWRIGMGLLALGALALAACGGSGEKAGSGAPDEGEARAPAARLPAASEPAAEPAVEKPVVTPNQEARVEAAGQALNEQVAAAPGQALQEAQDAAGAAATTTGEKLVKAAEATTEEAAGQAKPGESVTRFDNDKLKEQGPVEFSHLKHKETFGQEKLDCKPCHMQPPPLFSLKKRVPGEARYTMDDMRQGKACGKCHDGKTAINGKTAFDVSSEDNCARCHEQ